MTTDAESYVLAIDLGTGGPKAGLVSSRGEIVAHAQRETQVLFLPGGGAEADPEAWWTTIVDAARAVLAESNVPRERVVAIGVTTQWSLTVPVDANGKALTNVVHWMDARGAKYVREITAGLIKIGGYNAFRLWRWLNRCGGAPTHTGADSLAHALFIKRERPEVYRDTHKLLEPMDYLTFRMTGRCATTGGACFAMWVTDNRHIHGIRYDDVLLARCGLDRDKLPEIVPPNSVLGTLRPQVAAEFGLPETVRVIAGSGDNHSAVIGSGAVRDFEGHCYIGTTSWISCHLPFKKTDLFHMMASFPAALPGKYLLLAQQGTGGECLRYLREVLFGGAPRSFDDLNQLAESSPPGANGLVFTPWLTGALTPADDPSTRSAFFNQTLKTTRGDYVRAVMEGVACNLRWLLPYAEKFVGRPFAELRLIGGGAQSDLWCQVLADVLDRPVHQVAQPRLANVRGAAFAAFLALNRIGLDDVSRLVPIQKTFTPRSEVKNVYHELFATFIEIYRRNKQVYAWLNARR